MKRTGFQREKAPEIAPILEPADEWAFAPWTPEGGPLLAKTMQGLEPVLAEELRKMGAAEVQELTRAVMFQGDQRLLYRANYELRTALRVLVPLHGFSATTEKEFYAGIREIDWSKHLDVDGTLAVDAVVQSTVFRHSQFMSLLTKDAIVDQFRESSGRRPSVNLTEPNLRIHVHIRNHTQVQVLIDASGDSLHLRGYRHDHVAAPINEVLAAGMILLSGWNGQCAFADPMCGSGTLPIEAAMIARNIPPQRKRSIAFGFTQWPGYDAKLWESVQRVANERISEFEFPIFASDMDSRARNATASNALAAGLEKDIIIEKIRFEQLIPPAERGWLIMNPPYDERLKVEEIEAFYGRIGERLKHHWAGWQAWIISANTGALKHIGLRPSRRFKLVNGALDCAYQGFELFEGKRKDSKQLS